MRPLLNYLEKWSYIKLILDYITFIVFLLLFSYYSFFNLSINNFALLNFLYIPFFIFNYLTDKYKNFYNKKEFLKNLFINSSIGFICSYFVINLFLNLNNLELINSTESYFNFAKFHFYLFFLSNLIQISIEYLVKNLNIIQEKWLFVGFSNIKDHINLNIPNYLKLEYLESPENENIDYKKLANYKGLIIHDNFKSNTQAFEHISNTKEIKILSFF